MLRRCNEAMRKQVGLKYPENRARQIAGLVRVVLLGREARRLGFFGDVTHHAGDGAPALGLTVGGAGPQQRAADQALGQTFGVPAAAHSTIGPRELQDAHSYR
jgi:hypothetical protein